MHNLDLKSTCVQVVESRWLGGVQLVCLTHSQPAMRAPWGKSRRVVPMFDCIVPMASPQPISAFNSYVFNFSPLSTALINTRTKFIKETLL